MTEQMTIKTITVDRRQLTIAMYRQLLEVDLINDDASLNGVPWGWVNRHDRDCDSFGSHLHVVWADANNLYRNRVAMSPFFARSVEPEAGPAYVNALVGAAAAGDTDDQLHDFALEAFYETFRGVTAALKYQGAAFDVARALELHSAARNVAREQGPGVVMRTYRRPSNGRSPQLDMTAAARVVKYEAELAEALQRLPRVDLTEARNALHAELGREADRRERQLTVRRSLANLDQLFIGA